MTAQPILNLDWLADTFDIGKPLHYREVEPGQSNPYAVLRVETSRGCYGIKRYSQRPQWQALNIEYSAAAAGIPIAMPLLTRGGKPLARFEVAGEMLWIHAYTWVDGTPFEWNTVHPAIAYRIGRLLAAIHALKVPADVLVEESRRPLGESDWLNLAQQAERAGVEWASLLKQQVGNLVAWEELVAAHKTADEPPVPSQRDLHPPNIIGQSDGSVAAVDWDGAGSIIARDDVAMFALVWATHGDGSINADAVHSFIRGYRDNGGIYKSRGYIDLLGRERNRLAWVEYNVRRHITAVPGPFPWLPGALLSGINAPDLAGLRRIATLLAA